MDEQVVPTFNIGDVSNDRSLFPTHPVKNAKTLTTNPQKVRIRSVPHPSTTKSKLSTTSKTTETETALSTTTSEISPKSTPITFGKYTKDDQTLPPSEYRGKLRWQTPSRTGKWREPWNSAVQLCPLPLHSPITLQSSISTILRGTLSKAIVTYVGPLLPPQTVNKWLCLLCEYLELNTDEEILVTCLLRRYSKQGGKFITNNDWVRPQKWECVIAIACYLAVLLTEEFPGRTALDLRELLGTGFKFGMEQVNFLKSVDWRICIDTSEVNDVLDCCKRCVNGDVNAYKEMDQWFSTQTRDVSDAKLWDHDLNEKQIYVPSPTKPQLINNEQAVVDSNSKVKNNFVINNTNTKKRPFTSIAPVTNQEDSVVPRYVIRRIDPAVNSSGGIVYHQQQIPLDPVTAQNYMIPTLGQNPGPLPTYHLQPSLHNTHEGMIAAHAAAAAAAGIPGGGVPLWTAPRW